MTGSRRQADPRPPPHQRENDVTGGTTRYFHAGTAPRERYLGLTRNQAITAMVLAETVAGGIGDHTDKRWLFIESWANELGMTGTDAVGKIGS